MNPNTDQGHQAESSGNAPAFSEMTLRDFFAAKALAGMLADLPKSLYGLAWIPNTAVVAYELADAMLKERQQ